MLALAVAFALAAPAESFPAFTDYVVDEAGIIDPASLQHLRTVASRLDHAGVAQIAVATVLDLGGASIDDYGADLFRKWGIGHDKKRKDGLLLIFHRKSAGHGQVRIEVKSSAKP